MHWYRRQWAKWAQKVTLYGQRINEEGGGAISFRWTWKFPDVRWLVRSLPMIDETGIHIERNRAASLIGQNARVEIR